MSAAEGMRRVGTFLRWPLYSDAGPDALDEMLHLVAVAACKAIDEVDNTGGYGEQHGGHLEYLERFGVVLAYLGERSFAVSLGDFRGDLYADLHRDREGFEGTLLYDFFLFDEAA